MEKLKDALTPENLHRVLEFMGDQAEAMFFKDISTRTGVPHRHLEILLGKLTEEGYVESNDSAHRPFWISYKGADFLRRGGYLHGEQPTEIRITPQILVLQCLDRNDGPQILGFIADETSLPSSDVRAHLDELVGRQFVATNGEGSYMGTWWVLPKGRAWLREPLVKRTVGDNRDSGDPGSFPVDPFKGIDRIGETLPARTVVKRGPDVQTPGGYSWDDQTPQKRTRGPRKKADPPAKLPEPPLPIVKRPNWCRRRYNWWMSLTDGNRIAIIVPTALALLALMFTPSIIVQVQQSGKPTPDAIIDTTSTVGASADPARSPTERTDTTSKRKTQRHCLRC